MDSTSPAPLAMHNSPASQSKQQEQAAAGASAPPMSSRPTTSSTSTATPLPLKEDQQDPSKLDISSPHELTAFVDDVLSRLEATFDNMSSQVLDRLDTISKRIDTIELSISDLMQGNTLDEPAAVKRSSEDSRAAST